MSKPHGLRFELTPDGLPQARVISPTAAEDAIHRAVEEAIAAGMTVRDFIKNARESWDIELSEDKKHADRQFREALNNPTR